MGGKTCFVLRLRSMHKLVMSLTALGIWVFKYLKGSASTRAVQWGILIIGSGLHNPYNLPKENTQLNSTGSQDTMSMTGNNSSKHHILYNYVVLCQSPRQSRRK